MVAREYSLKEEMIHSGLHGGGAVLFCALAAFLAVRSQSFGFAATLAATLYGVSAVVTFLASFLFHSARHGSRIKSRLEAFDHSAIYFMIFGTYLPMAVCTFDDGAGYAFLILCAIMTVLGVLVSVSGIGGYGDVGFALYLGAAGAVLLGVLFHLGTVGVMGGVLIFGGVICYTVGVFFYKMREVRYMHSLWHALVLLGAILHFFAVLIICYT